jgi:dephospho-CoA kinase
VRFLSFLRICLLATSHHLFHASLSIDTHTFSPCSSEILQLQRLRARNNLSLSDAQARLSSQSPLSSKLVYADFVIDNSGPLGDLTAQVEGVVKKLRKKAGWSWWLSWLCPPIGILRGLLRVGWRLYVKGVGKEKRRTRGEGKKKPEEIELKERTTRRD